MSRGATASEDDVAVTIVRACLREVRGGSPTAVIAEAAMSDDERRRVPVLTGTSHAVFVSVEDERGDGPEVSVRFFTSAGELPGCGHGTVAALAFVAVHAGRNVCPITVRTSGRTFTGRVVRVNGGFEAVFDPGLVELREPVADECRPVLDALGSLDLAASATCVASLGRPRLLVAVPSRSALAALAPDFDRLRDACDRLGLLGAYVYSVPTADGGVAARMFAPSIGVPEDIANANSSACLAAYLAGEGITAITVDMGDALDSPATIVAGTSPGEAGPRVFVGGAATIAHVGSLGL